MLFGCGQSNKVKEEDPCGSSRDCGDGKDCIDGECILVRDSGCDKDTDCKGDRICHKGVCVNPSDLANGGDGDAQDRTSGSTDIGTASKDAETAAIDEETDAHNGLNPITDAKDARVDVGVSSDSSVNTDHKDSSKEDAEAAGSDGSSGSGGSGGLGDSDGGCSGSCNQTCCGNECVDIETDEEHCGFCTHPCHPGFECVDGRCACDRDDDCQGRPCCDGKCVDTTSDPDNCGECGNACDSGCCLSGACGQKCGENCVDIKTDAYNCGACNIVCIPFAQLCCNGGCEFGYLVCP